MPRRIRKLSPVFTSMDATLFDQMQQVRKDFKAKTGKEIGNATASRILAKNIRFPIRIPDISLRGKNGAKKNKK